MGREEGSARGRAESFRGGVGEAHCVGIGIGRSAVGDRGVCVHRRRSTGRSSSWPDVRSFCVLRDTRPRGCAPKPQQPRAKELLARPRSKLPDLRNYPRPQLRPPCTNQASPFPHKRGACHSAPWQRPAVEAPSWARKVAPAHQITCYFASSMPMTARLSSWGAKNTVFRSNQRSGGRPAEDVDAHRRVAAGGGRVARR